MYSTPRFYLMKSGGAIETSLKESKASSSLRLEEIRNAAIIERACRSISVG